MKKNIQITFLLGLMTLALAACVRAQGATGVVATPQETQAQVAFREAHVESVEIQMMKTEPVQVNAVVRGKLTEACATLADTQMSYTSGTFMIKLMAKSPTDRGCAQIDTPFEQTIPLNTADLPDGSYTVKANGVSAVFTLPAGATQTAVPDGSGKPGQTKTYHSDLYGYQVSYPAGWTVQVNTSVPAGDGSNPEYVTLAANANSLPRIEIDVLTGTPPMLGYENCEKNFVFRNLPACKISLPAGQNPAAEVWIFQNGSANFYIAMSYEGAIPAQLFTDFLSSFEFTLTGSPSTGNPAPCTDPVALAPGSDGRVVYKGVSFVLDPALGKSVMVQECPSVPFSDDSIPGAAHPSYIAFTFPTERTRIDYQPELRVYSVDGDMQSFLYPINSLKDLWSAVSNQPEPITWFDGTVLHVQRSYLSFANGKGVRGVVEYAQDIFFFTNNGLLYEYDGLAEGGHFYVNLRYPVAAPFLMDIENSDPNTNTNPQAIAIPGWGSDYKQQRKIIDAYNQEALSRLEGMQASEFAPSLDLMDGLVKSLEIK